MADVEKHCSIRTVQMLRLHDSNLSRRAGVAHVNTSLNMFSLHIKVMSLLILRETDSHCERKVS